MSLKEHLFTIDNLNKSLDNARKGDYSASCHGRAYLQAMDVARQIHESREVNWDEDFLNLEYSRLTRSLNGVGMALLVTYGADLVNEKPKKNPDHSAICLAGDLVILKNKTEYKPYFKHFLNHDEKRFDPRCQSCRMTDEYIDKMTKMLDKAIDKKSGILRLYDPLNRVIHTHRTLSYLEGTWNNEMALPVSLFIEKAAFDRIREMNLDEVFDSIDGAVVVV